MTVIYCNGLQLKISPPKEFNDKLFQSILAHATSKLENSHI